MNKSEQKGILLLLLLILLVLIFNLFLPGLISKSETDFSEFRKEITQFRAQRDLYYDSIDLNKKQSKGELTEEDAKRIIKPFNFDPNTLDENGWLKMGFTSKQFKVINNYREKGGRFKSSKDVRKMYCISEMEFEIIKPFIKIKEQNTIVTNKTKKKEKSTEKTKTKKITASKEKIIFEYSITEINSADSTILVTNLDIKPWLAIRVVKYRNVLGGYFDRVQLLEVYGLSEEYYEKIEPFVMVDTLLIQKIDINNVAFKQLLKHPYFDYETTKLIFNNKPKNKDKAYADYFDFKQRTVISDSLGFKIRHYLYFGPPK